MDDVVAVAVDLDTGATRYFVTWGRVVDPDALEALVLRHAHGHVLGGLPVKARLCPSLQDAAGEPRFYEVLIALAREPVPLRPEAWRKRKASAMELGRELHFLGVPPGPSA